MSIWKKTRFRTRLAALLIGLVMAIAVVSPGLSASPNPDQLLQNERVPIYPLSRQPFFNDLNQLRVAWQDQQLGEVVADNPRGTLLNFYVVMAEVVARAHAISEAGASEPGLMYSPELRQQIEETQNLFQLAVTALDGSVFAQSIREDASQQAALQLKSVLDFVFYTSAKPLNLADSATLRTLRIEQGQAINRWRIPGTAIVLSNTLPNEPDQTDFIFNAETVRRVLQMYAVIKHVPIPADRFTTWDAYTDYAHTPGGIVPPKWYLKLPAATRRVLELNIGEQTLLQAVLSVMIILLGSLVAYLLITQFLKTYRFRPATNDDLPSLKDDNLAWKRVLLLLPILPMARFSELIIDDFINITGPELEIITSTYYVVYFVTASVLSYLTLEALGRSGAEWLVRMRGSRSPLMLQRMNNLLLPICRTLGSISALFLLYRLLIQLGLPSTTVLAFSAVPGLAIGLGASKLLGNLFAGLAIQTDRPLRVGEFCQVGDNTGFITKIGLRSLELQTLESRITIPNAMADEATIVNFSRRSNAEAIPQQTLDLRLQIEDALSPEQVGDLLDYTRTMLSADPELDDALVSINQSSCSSLELICFAMVQLHGWPAYLSVRERVLRKLQELVDTVKKSRIVVGVSYNTTAEQLAAIPQLIKTVVNTDPHFQWRSCRLMTIGEFSYDFVFDFRTSHGSYAAFKDGIQRLNQDLLATFERQHIEIPFPTVIELDH